MENLPSEIQWNIIKYMSHPVAELFRCVSVEYYFDEDEGGTFVYLWFRRKQFLQRIHELEKMVANTPLCKTVKNNALRYYYNQMLRFYPC